MNTRSFSLNDRVFVYELSGCEFEVEFEFRFQFKGDSKKFVWSVYDLKPEFFF